MERRLKPDNLWSEANGRKELTADFNREIDEAIAFAEGSPSPEGNEALDHVFSFSIRERELERKTWSPKFERNF